LRADDIVDIPLYHQPQPNFVYDLDDDEVVSEVIDHFRRELPTFAHILCSCPFCDRMILTAWPAKDLPPVLVLTCQRCEAEKRSESLRLTKSN
jgi:hypothetical protein